MVQGEGTIRFRWDLCPGSERDALPLPSFAALEGWRRVLRRVGLVGRDSGRYGGFAFGNLSVRDPADPGRFFITASQTIDADALSRDALTRIDHADPEQFFVRATGSRPPSSETLTHRAVYAGDDATRWLFHVHCPEIWHHARALDLPATGADIAYGTPALAADVARLLAAERRRPLVFVTPGHQDGVFACAADAEAAGCSVLALLARAIVLEAP